MVNARRTGDASRRAFEVRAAALGIVLAATWAAGTVRAEIVGASGPVGFSLCEERTDDTGAPRPECQASDLRFQGSSSAESEFGFAVGVGHLNGEGREDLGVSDPTRNRV